MNEPAAIDFLFVFVEEPVVHEAVMIRTGWNDVGRMDRPLVSCWDDMGILDITVEPAEDALSPIDRTLVRLYGFSEPDGFRVLAAVVACTKLIAKSSSKLASESASFFVGDRVAAVVAGSILFPFHRKVMALAGTIKSFLLQFELVWSERKLFLAV